MKRILMVGTKREQNVKQIKMYRKISSFVYF